MSSWIMDVRLKPAACSDISPFSQPAMAEEMEVLAVGSAEMLCRPCVDCGQYTGSFCEGCFASDRIPSEEWASGQMTPLCSVCDESRGACHYCHRVSLCRPFAWGVKPKEQPGAPPDHCGGPPGAMS